MAGSYEVLGPGSREFLDLGGKKSVKAVAGMIHRDEEVMVSALFLIHVSRWVSLVLPG